MNNQTSDREMILYFIYTAVDAYSCVCKCCARNNKWYKGSNHTGKIKKNVVTFVAKLVQMRDSHVGDSFIMRNYSDLECIFIH